MIKYQNKDLSIEIKGVNESLSAQVDALERIVKFSLSAPLEIIQKDTPQDAGIRLLKSEERPSVLESVQRNTAIQGTSGMDRSMKKRIPNVLDLKDLNIVEAKKYEGFRCPSCNQSFLLNLNPSDSISGAEFIIRLEDGIHDLKGVLLSYDSSEDYDKEIGDNSQELFKPYISREKLFLTKDTEHSCSCPRCGLTDTMSAFVEDFEETSSEFDHPCLYCGGEVVPSESSKENTSALCCEDCKSKIQY